MNMVGLPVLGSFISDTLFEQEMTMRKLLLILMMVTFAGVNTTNAAHIKGAGITSCGKAMSQTKDDYVVENILMGWMTGFISGLNTANASDKGANTDSEAIWYAVINRCQAKPLQMFADATLWVYRNELTE